jgi:hypothetical protein
VKTIPDYSAGTAGIRIKPNAEDFVRDLKAKLAAVRDPGFSVRVEADVSSASRETTEWRKTEERNEVDVPVDAETAKASAELAAWRERQEANPVNVRVVVQHEGADQNLRQLEKRLESLRRSDFLRLNVGALGAAAFQPAITGLAELAAGLQQVAQAGIAVPGVVAGVVASVGTLAIGLSGIKTPTTRSVRRRRSPVKTKRPKPAHRRPRRTRCVTPTSTCSMRTRMSRRRPKTPNKSCRICGSSSAAA